VSAAEARSGGIDVLVNNAGYGHMGMFEDTTEAEVRAQFETNVFGLFNVTRAVLPGMRARRRGHVMNLSSVAGSVGFTTASLYCASKFAVEGFSYSLAGELKDFGIHVTIVSPGFIRTDFLEPTSIRNSDSRVDDYAATSAQIRAQFASYNQQQSGDPARLAAALLTLAADPNPPLRWAAGSDAVQMMAAQIEAARGELDRHRELSASVDGRWG
jgi:NAD(P)-dependent dehydrogenase (short-subunit alcohol dehydrogenase family)